MQLTQLIKGWGLMRILRLGIGLIVGYNGLLEQDYLLIFLGGILILQSLANTGCGFGSNSSCEINPTKKSNKDELSGTD